MRFWILLLLVLMASIGLALVLQADSGYVQIRWYHWNLETTLPIFMGCAVLMIVLLLVLWRLVSGLLHLPTYFSQMRQSRRQELTHQSLVKGLRGLGEGDFLEAERNLLRHAEHAPVPIIHYLLAALAAQLQGEPTRRQEHITQAARCTPSAGVVVTLMQAWLQLLGQEYVQALATLDMARVDKPNGLLLKLRLRCLLALKNWSGIRDLLPELKQAHVLPMSEWEVVARRAVLEDMVAACRRHDLAALQTQWQNLPLTLRQHEGLKHAYVRSLNELGGAQLADVLIEEHLAQQWSQLLVIDYGRLKLPNPARRLQKVHQWMERYGQQAALSWACGCLYLQMQDWAQAERALQDSLTQHARPEVYAVLAELYEQRNEPVRARQAYQAALQLYQQPAVDLVEQHDGQHCLDPSVVP